jgi:D-glycero-alpha-D-manno-heptose 1-phosphate guanylyltransferase
MTTAVILAGGLGTRLRNVVAELPKPMAPIHGRPFLEYQMDYWIDQGVSRFILSIGYLHEKIIKHFGCSYNGVDIEYVVESNPLGTGGGLISSLEKIGEAPFFLLLNGDTFFTIDLNSLINFSNIKKADWSFCTFKNTNTQRYMGLTVGEDGMINQLNAVDCKGKSLANGGVYWVKTSALKGRKFSMKFPQGVPVSLEGDIFEYELNRGARIFSYESEGEFIDIGTPNDYFSSFELFKNK